MKVSANILINKPIEEVFDYTASPHNGPAFIPNLNENTNISPETPCVGQTFDWRFNLAGLDLDGKAECIEFDRPHKSVVKSNGEKVNTTWVYTFQEENGGTRVHAEIEYDIANNLLQKFTNETVLEKLNQRSADQSLENLKTILES